MISKNDKKKLKINSNNSTLIQLSQKELEQISGGHLDDDQIVSGVARK